MLHVTAWSIVLIGVCAVALAITAVTAAAGHQQCKIEQSDYGTPVYAGLARKLAEQMRSGV